MSEHQHPLTAQLLDALALNDFDNTAPYQSMTELALVIYSNVVQLIRRSRNTQPDDTNQWLSEVYPDFQTNCTSCFYEEDLDNLLVGVQSFMDTHAESLGIEPAEWQVLVTGEINRTMQQAREVAEVGLLRLKETDPGLAAKVEGGRARVAAIKPESWRPNKSGI